MLRIGAAESRFEALHAGATALVGREAEFERVLALRLRRLWRQVAIEAHLSSRVEPLALKGREAAAWRGHRDYRAGCESGIAVGGGYFKRKEKDFLEDRSKVPKHYCRL